MEDYKPCPPLYQGTAPTQLESFFWKKLEVQVCLCPYSWTPAHISGVIVKCKHHSLVCRTLYSCSSQ